MLSSAPQGSFCLCRDAQLQLRKRPVFGNGRRLYQCAHCGLHQLAPYPVATNSDDAIYRDPDYLDAIADEEYFGYFRALYDCALRDLLTPTSRVLDFGAGTCHYHRFLRDLGHTQVYSLEINPHLARAARERHGLEGVVTRFEELPPEPFDLVYSNQVLEHIFDPLTLINGPIADRLAPGGRLVFTVPNFASLNRSLLGHRWIGYSPTEHIWFFTADCVRRLLKDSAIFTVKRTAVHSAVNTPYDRFRPRSAVKRAYYQTVMRVAEAMGRGDQLIVVLQKQAPRA